ncbi:MAG: rRNA pseudouridine synthase [Pleurocapsa sp. SU_196_0]|nr:rRNA pseudouridine synthase [Pleurocapsa sp. SU_196_0]
MAERLQKLIARAGIASRRGAEDLLKAGRVRVNGRVAKLGDSALESDDVRVDGQALTLEVGHVTFALHKPRGVVTTASDEFGRMNVLELVPDVRGLHPVGRLDRDSEGLLILTTDGDLTLKLTHPRFEHEKEYRVWTDPMPTRRDLETLRRGVQLEDGLAVADSAALAEDGAVIVLREGRNRQVRRMFEAIGLHVVRLQRRRIGAFNLADLQLREWRELNARDLEKLLKPTAGRGSRA